MVVDGGSERRKLICNLVRSRIKFMTVKSVGCGCVLAQRIDVFRNSLYGCGSALFVIEGLLYSYMVCQRTVGST